MEDTDIVALIYERNENGIREVNKKYGAYCRSVAFSFLGNGEDAEECLNDTLLGVWNSIPPAKPEALPAFLAKITRHIAIGRWRQYAAEKRGGGKTDILINELEECLPSGSSVESEYESTLLKEAVREFVNSLPETERRIFVRRYFFADSIEDTASRFGFTKPKTKSILHRIRIKLKKKLEKEGLL